MWFKQASAQQWLGLTIDTIYAKEMLNRVFGDNMGSRSRGDTGLRHLVVALNKLIWDYCCRIIFEREAFDFEVLESFSPCACFSPWNVFIFFVKYFLNIYSDFGATSWESHRTSFTIAGMCSGCRWFAHCSLLIFECLAFLKYRNKPFYWFWLHRLMKTSFGPRFFFL